MTLRFGTDGVRGDAARDLTPPLVAALGRAAARVLGTGRPFLVARDTRESGPRIEADLRRGLAAEGADAISCGVLPTPGVAYLAAASHRPAAMISASHNPWHDNGVKLFAPGGLKLTDGQEADIEAEVQALVTLATPADGGETEAPGGGHATALDDYERHLAAALDGRRLDGLHVVVDCANGAASEIAPRVLRDLGARVTVLHAAPDGRNINADCGSTHPGELQRSVVAVGAHAGLAFDGDADRVLAVDERGSLVDGDMILVLAALDLQEQGRLRGDAVVVTVMSNLGLHRALRAAGIGVVECPVGDRNVLVALEERGLGLGGEQSGHVIFRDLATTGDGTLTGLLLLDRMVRAGRPLSELAAAMTPVPQLLENVPVEHRPALDDEPLRSALAEVAAALGDAGRVLVRPSGTEPVVRIMVEAADRELAQRAVERLRAAVVAASAGPGPTGS